jgi:hypothetical protein
MTNGFGPELEVKSRVFQHRGGFAVESLTKAFRRAIHLRAIRLGDFPVNPFLEQRGFHLRRNIFATAIISKALDFPAKVWTLIMLLEVDKAVIDLALSLDSIDS